MAEGEEDPPRRFSEFPAAATTTLPLAIASSVAFLRASLLALESPAMGMAMMSTDELLAAQLIPLMRLAAKLCL